MNFFAQQDHARRQTRWLVVLFILAVLVIVVAVDFALLLAFGTFSAAQDTAAFSAQGIYSSVPMLIGGAAGTASVIGLASMGTLE